MKCYKCPMIKEEFDQRILRLDCSEYCGFIYWEDVESDHVDYCYCDKTGGKLCLTGRCDEAEYITEEEWEDYRKAYGLITLDDTLLFIDDTINDPINDPLKPTKKQKKRVRDKKYKEKQSRIYNALSNWYPTPMWPRYKDADGKVFYFKVPGRNHYKRWLKKEANKRVRRTKDAPKNGKSYRKFLNIFRELW